MFQGQFQCLGENTKKRNIFFVPIEKEVIKIDKDGNENVISISYKIKFIDKPRFMASSSSNLVDNLAEGIHISLKIVIVFLSMKVSLTIW